jgi:hypothetical protein
LTIGAGNQRGIGEGLEKSFFKLLKLRKLPEAELTKQKGKWQGTL